MDGGQHAARLLRTSTAEERPQCERAGFSRILSLREKVGERTDRDASSGPGASPSLSKAPADV